MPKMLVLKPGYSFVEFTEGGRKTIAHRPADPEKRGTDEEFCYPAADPRIGEKQLHKFYPYGNPDAQASAHAEADDAGDRSYVPPEADDELDELAADGADDDADDEETDDEEEEDPLERLEE